MKKLAISLVLSFIIYSAFSQNIGEIIPAQPGEIEIISMPKVDNLALIEAELNSRTNDRAPRFAESFNVDINPSNSGSWESLSDGNLMWRLSIQSNFAKSINLGFSQYVLPKDAGLIVYNPSTGEKIGPFSYEDNDEHEQLWTPVIEGDHIVLQLIISPKRMSSLKLQLSHVNHDFIGFRNLLSGSCNVDVVCGSEDGPEFELIDQYRDIIRSVGLATFSGNAFCTGFLVNNVRQDRTPYYMTAAHCNVSSGNAPTIVVYWNYQNSTCRTPGSSQSGSSGDGNFNVFNTGTILRSDYSPTDFSLLELDDPVTENANAFFAGWDRRIELPGDTVICVHHPSLDEKRISFEYQEPYRGTWQTGGANISNGNHLIIGDWDLGTTEPGSSGAPLFNKNKQVIGQLHGGQAACGNNEYDSYGWFAYSWNGGGTSLTRLKDWLDPDDTGVETLNGLGETIVLAVTPNYQKACMPESFSFNVEIPNAFENSATLSATGLPDGANISYSQNPATPGTTVNITIDNLAGIDPSTYTIDITAEDSETTAIAELVFTTIGDMELSPVLVSPPNLAEDESLNPDLTWNILGSSDLTHQIQIANDMDFVNIIVDQENLVDREFKSPSLQIESTYFWRVRTKNLCNYGPWSSTRSFTTGSDECISAVSDDTPIPISSAGTPTVSSTKFIENEGVISDIESITIDIDHSYIGDLEARLISPSGTVIRLFDRPGFPATQFGCDGINMRVSFSDTAPNTAADFENECTPGVPAINGTFQPLDPLNVLIGEDLDGPWILRLTDNENQDGGSLVNWEINACTSNNSGSTVTISPGDLLLCNEEITPFEVLIGGGFNPEGVNLSVDNLPDGLFVNLENDQVLPGATINADASSVDLPAGNYTFSLIANDELKTVTEEVQVEIGFTPLEIELNEPIDAADQIDINPIFNWNMEEGVGIYILDVSRNETFLDLAYSVDLISSPFELTDIDLDYETTYFWRIRGINQCGETVSPSFTFTTTESSSTLEIDLENIRIFPNPTDGWIEVNLGREIQQPFELELISPSGQIFYSQSYFRGENVLFLDLGKYPKGLYFLQLKGRSFAFTRKIMLID